MEALKRSDIENIVSTVGRDGAISALKDSKLIKVDYLLEFARSLGIAVKRKDAKGKLAKDIVYLVDKRINKTIDELMLMSNDEIIEYFEGIQCDSEEIIDFLDGINLRAKVKSKRQLIEFAATQISNLGIFSRLSEKRG